MLGHRHPGVVDDQIDGAEPLLDLVGVGEHSRAVGHVEPVGLGLDTVAPAGIDGGADVLLVDVRQRQPRAFGGELLARALARSRTRRR